MNVVGDVLYAIWDVYWGIAGLNLVFLVFGVAFFVIGVLFVGLGVLMVGAIIIDLVRLAWLFATTTPEERERRAENGRDWRFSREVWGPSFPLARERRAPSLKE